MKILFPDDTVLVTKTFKVEQDWETPISGFFTIASLDKTKRTIADFTDEELTELILTMKKVRYSMTDCLGIKDVYIFQNEDTETWFHIWMFPRYEWMEKFGLKVESVRPIMNFAREHMVDEATIKQVSAEAQKIKSYLNHS